MVSRSLGLLRAGEQLARRPRFSQVFAGQAVGFKGVHDDIWLVSFMEYDLGYFDLETRVLAPLENPFGPKALPM
jgi:putative transposase